jgi:hypothetical protein
LIGIRRINGTHNNKNITEAIIPILQEINIVFRLKYFIEDNYNANAIYLRVIYRRLRSDIKDSDNRRVRCLKYILNLTAKAFLFNKDADVFENTINSIREKNYIIKFRKE